MLEIFKRKTLWRIVGGVLLGAFAAWLMSGVRLSKQLKRLAALDEQVVQLWSHGKIAEAIPLAEEALVLSKKVYGKDMRKQGHIILALARLHLAQKNYIQAEPLFQQNLEIVQNENGPERDANIAGSQVWLAECYRQERKFAAAEALLLQALPVTEKAFGPDHQKVADVLAYLAAVYLAENRVLEAEGAIRRALDISRTTYGNDRPELLPFLYYQLDILKHQQKYAEAVSVAEQILSIEVRIYPSNDPHLQKLQQDINTMKVALQTAAPPKKSKKTKR